MPVKEVQCGGTSGIEEGERRLRSGYMVSCIHMKQNKETSCNCFKWFRERVDWEKCWG
jgi:hypothetical protein